MPTLSCPYCYRSFKERRIQFRCCGRRTASGRTCSLEPDKLLANRMGDNEKKYPAFEADGRRAAATCPHCKEVTHHRLCPECHMRLPADFGRVEGRLIALVGAKGSGKTIYMTVLLHELMHTVGARFNAAVLGADERTREKFGHEYEHRLYRRRELMGPTTTETATTGRQPLVFTFTIGVRGARSGGTGLTARVNRGLSPLWRGGPRRTLLSFFDTAGEDLKSNVSVEQNVRYLNSADGIILLLDPLEMPGSPSVAQSGDRAEAVPGHDPANVLGRIIEMLKGDGEGGRGLIRKPLAVVFSKMDAFDRSLPLDNPLLREQSDDPSFDEIDSVDVHEYMRELLRKWDGGNIDNVLAGEFETCRYFGVSALGNQPVTGANASEFVSEAGIQPRRVADPFLWLLTRFSAIPVSRRRQDGA